MSRLSAGLLLYRDGGGSVEVLIGHPGGPFWARKDEGAWSIPKGEYIAVEDPWAVARRSSSGDLELDGTFSNTFTLEWPPGLGQRQGVPRDRPGAWLAVPAARSKLAKGQRPLLDRLEDALERPASRQRW